MRIGLVSYRCENRNISFNMDQIELALKRTSGKADVLCFSEAFLQGFDSLCWNYETDKSIAIERSSKALQHLKCLTKQYGIALITGYIEKDQDILYSSCAVISDGEIICNYRRITRGWKEYSITDEHYCEGTEIKPFRLNGKDMCIALCGDLWDLPERFRTQHILIWPVYTDYTLDEWNCGALDEYAVQAASVSDNVFMINPICRDPVNHGGSFFFQKGHVTERIPFDEEGILIVEIP